MGAPVEVHHAVLRCLLRLHDAAKEPGLDGGHIQAWLEFEREVSRWGVPVEIDRADLEALVEAPEAALGREAYRVLHASDWARWGALGEVRSPSGATGARGWLCLRGGAGER